MTATLFHRSAGVLRRTRIHVTLVVVALVAALFGATMVSAGAAGARTQTHSRTGYESSIAKSVLGQLNGERRAHHLKPLRMSKQLQLSARRHNVTMAHFNLMTHQAPGEAFFANRIRRAGYKYRWAGENIGWNSLMTTGGVRQLESAMYNERPPFDGHRLNILSRHFRNVGIDVYLDQAHHKVWLTTDFGSK